MTARVSASTLPMTIMVVFVSTWPMPEPSSTRGSGPSALSVSTPRAWFHANPRVTTARLCRSAPRRRYRWPAVAATEPDRDPATPNTEPSQTLAAMDARGRSEQSMADCTFSFGDGTGLRRRWMWRRCSPCPHPRDGSTRRPGRTKDQLVTLARGNAWMPITGGRRKALASSLSLSCASDVSASAARRFCGSIFLSEAGFCGPGRG